MLTNKPSRATTITDQGTIVLVLKYESITNTTNVCCSVLHRTKELF